MEHTKQLCKACEDRPRIIILDHNSNQPYMHNVKIPRELRRGLVKNIPRMELDVSWQPRLGTDLVQADVKPVELNRSRFIASEVVKPDAVGDECVSCTKLGFGDTLPVARSNISDFQVSRLRWDVWMYKEPKQILPKEMLSCKAGFVARLIQHSLELQEIVAKLTECSRCSLASRRTCPGLG